MTFYVTTGHPLGKYRYSVPTGYSHYGSYSSKLSNPSKGYSSYSSSGSSYSTPYIPKISYSPAYVPKTSYSTPYVPKTSYTTPYVSRYNSYTPKTSYTPTTYSRPSYLTNSKLFSTPRKATPTYSEPRSNYSRTLRPLSDTFDNDYSYLKKSAPVELPRAPKRDAYSNYSSNKYLVRPKMMPLNDVSFKYSVSRYRGHLNDYLSWR